MLVQVDLRREGRRQVPVERQRVPPRRESLGVLAGVDARIAIFCAVIWLMVAYTTRYSSAAALSAALAAPLAGFLFLGAKPAVAVLAVMTAVLFWRHKENIARLRAGTEGKIGGKKKDGPTA